MKKSKFLKTFGFSSLALLMGIAGTMAFAPLGASASVASANEMVDQINTKADGENIKYAPSALGLDPENDPVIYTTESGLEIKFGGATTALGGGNETTDFVATLPNGKPLSGYPYFTMGTYSGYAVNWVIIGKSTSGMPSGTINLDGGETYDKLSVWQTKTNESPTYKAWFENQYESNSPAGILLKNNGVLDDYSALKIFYKIQSSFLNSTKTNSEIPSGCVLAISECCLGVSYFNCKSTPNQNFGSSGSGSYGGRYRFIASNSVTTTTPNVSFSYPANPEDGTLYTYIKNLYDNDLSLTNAQKQLIIPQKLNTAYAANSSSSRLETYDTDGNTLHNLFPMAGYKNTPHYSSSVAAPGEENFQMVTYLTQTALRLAYNIVNNVSITYWLRSSEAVYSSCGGSVGDSNYTILGDFGGSYAWENFGVRPACVVQFA